MIHAGMEEEVLSSNTPWYCLSCYFCTTRCPQEVHITDIMYTLKSMAIKRGIFKDSTAPDLSQTFVDQVENYGRSFEFGLATRHYLKHHPTMLFKSAQMGWGMLSRERLDLSPHRIEGVRQLQTILKRAKELEGAA